MDRHQRRMLQKRDEYLPKRRETMSKNELKKLEDDYRRWMKLHPYVVHLWHKDGRPKNILFVSKFPQRHPQFDSVMNQLMEEWRKRQAHQACKRIKEELMMNRWHPDRVEKLLELGVLEEEW